MTENWIIGRSGLLGSALARTLPGRLASGPRIPWHNPTEAAEALADGVQTFLGRLGPSTPWAVYWAAGAGVIGSNPRVFETETTLLETLLRELIRNDLPGRGAVFYASSAATYGSASGPPFSESTAQAPTSPYALAKCAQERLVSEILTGRLPHVVGRISTVPVRICERTKDWSPRCASEQQRDSP